MAVHTLRDGSSDAQRLNFLAEALTLGQFDHSHVVRLEGVITRGTPWDSVGLGVKVVVCGGVCCGPFSLSC